MARFPKIWLHAKSGFWCVQLNRKRHYLDRDPKVAPRKLLADEKRGLLGQREWLDAKFSELIDEFLDHTKSTRKHATYAQCRYALMRVLKMFDQRLRFGAC